MRSVASSNQEIRSQSDSSSIVEYARGVGGCGENARESLASHAAKRESTKKKNTILSTILAAYFSVGVIFGDIGTSPIYVYRVVFSILDVKQSTIYGTTSLIIWSFVFIVIIKYLVVMVSADDSGEGGCFAVYSIICRHLRLNASGEEPSFHDELDRQLTTYSNYDSKREKTEGDSLLGRSKLAQNLLLLLTLLSAALILGDGVLTPAVSVLSSMEGISVEVPSLAVLVLPLTCIIMFAVFVVQSLGTHRLSSTFSPIVMLWLLVNALIGIYNIVQYAPSILMAFSPHYAIAMIYENPYRSWLSLQGVLLCITGAEALFADMGHFTKSAIRLATLAVVLPSLTFTYLGQAAYILRFNESAENPFWFSIPKSVYWPVFGLSVSVTIIASQALISASFSIVHQAVSINCFPPIRINHTSKKVYGQIYASSLNYILMILSIGTVLLFKSSLKITSAYGVAVSIVMTLSFISASIVMYKVWELHWTVVALFFAVYTIVDGAYLTSNMLKTTSWGWYTIVISIIMVSLMVLWRWGKLLTLEASKKKSRSARLMYKGLLEKRSYENDNKQHHAIHNWNTFNNLGEIRNYAMSSRQSRQNADALAEKFRRHKSQKIDNNGEDYPGLVKIPGACVFYTNQHGYVPPVFYQYLETFPAVFSVTVFLHIRRAIVPYVVPEERLRVMELRYEGFYSVVATFGYMDVIEPGEKLAADIFAGLKRLEMMNYQEEMEYNNMMECIEKSNAFNGMQHDVLGHNAGNDTSHGRYPVSKDFSGPQDVLVTTPDDNKASIHNDAMLSEPGESLQQKGESGVPGDRENAGGVSHNTYRDKRKTSNLQYSAVKGELTDRLNTRINHIVHAYSTGVTYIISENYLFADKTKKWSIFSGLRKYLIETVFNFMRLVTVNSATLNEIPLSRSVVLSTKLEG